MTNVRRLIIKRAGVDVSDDCTLRDGKSNPFGWSQYKIFHVERAGMTEIETEVGWLYCGAPDGIKEPYTAEVIEEPADGA